MQAVDILAATVPKAVWARGSRPLRGTLFRLGLAATCGLVGLTSPALGPKVGLLALAVAVFLAINPLVDARLESLGQRIARSTRSEANAWLKVLEQRRFVVNFAPHAWVALQRGQLHMRLGNWRGAAKDFADCGRLAAAANHPRLLSAQAQALMLAGDRREAAGLLAELADRMQLGPRDHLYQAVTHLDEGRSAALARTHLEQARAALGEHPQVLAATALMHARCADVQEGVGALNVFSQLEGIHDEFAAELAKRARKLLRPELEAQQRRQRKQVRAAAARPRQDVTPSAGDTPRSAAAGRAPKQSRKDKRKDKKRKQGKQDKRPSQQQQQVSARLDERETAASPTIVATHRTATPPDVPPAPKVRAATPPVIPPVPSVRPATPPVIPPVRTPASPTIAPPTLRPTAPPAVQRPPVVRSATPPVLSGPRSPAPQLPATAADASRATTARASQPATDSQDRGQGIDDSGWDLVLTESPRSERGNNQPPK